MTREVIFSPEALQDLFELYDYIAADSGATRARGYTDRIVAACLGLVTFPEGGTRRDDLRPGLRTTTFRRRATIAFHITAPAPPIDRRSRVEMCECHRWASPGRALGTPRCASTGRAVCRIYIQRPPHCGNPRRDAASSRALARDAVCPRRARSCPSSAFLNIFP